MLQAPGIKSLIAIVLSITGTGIAIDKLVLSKHLAPWRWKLQQYWIKLNTPGARGLVQDANQLYCDLFDYIYGRKTFTWHRIWTSILSSTIGLFVFTFIVGEDAITWNFFKFLGYDIIFLLVPVFFNLIPDFFSLWETRKLLDWSKTKVNLEFLY